MTSCQYTRRSPLPLCAHALLFMSANRPPTLDPIAVARWQHIAPLASPWLHEEVAQRMRDRLQWIKLRPAAWVHWGALRGGLQAHRGIAATYPGATCFVVEATAERAQAAIRYIASTTTIAPEK